MNTSNLKLLYTINEASAQLCRGRTSIYADIKSGKLKAVKDGKHRLITGESIKKYVEDLVREQEVAL